MSTVQTISQETSALNMTELEALIRRVVREEVTRAFEAWGFYEEPTIIEPGSPIDEDLTELLRMKEEGTLYLLKSVEVWGPEDELSS